MKLSILGGLAAALLVAAPAPTNAHPHEWVDWGVGLVLDENKPLKAQTLFLELTWDEWYSALVLTDFPGIAKNQMSAADLRQLDAVYGLGSAQRSTRLTVTWGGRPVAVKPVVQPPRTNGKTVTLVYAMGLGFSVANPTELRVSIYDPTYYTDMGIRAQSGAFFRGVKDPKAYTGATSYEQDFDRPYYGGQVFPEVVVFALKP